jgi:adenylyltransferase/sulfurtransferase
MQEITPTELKKRLDAGEDIQIIDVREQNEFDHCRIPGTVLIPLGQVIERMSEIDVTRETVVHCKMGGRSARARSKRCKEQDSRANFQTCAVAS